MGWNDVNNNSNDKQEVQYFKFKNGVAVGRILDAEPETKWTHWIPQANGGKGYSVDCIGRDCPVCENIKFAKAEKKTPPQSVVKTHRINFHQTKDGAETKDDVVVLEKGDTFFGLLKGAMDSMKLIREQQGLPVEGYVPDLRNALISIQTTNAGTKQATYSINIIAELPLSAEKKAELDARKYDLKNIKAKHTPEQLIELCNGASYKDIYGEKTDEEATDPSPQAPEVDFSSEV